MSRRPAASTQADLARCIRAARANGLRVVGMVARPDGIYIQTADEPSETVAVEKVEPKTNVVL